jgi:structural maintenance of chromosome 1
MDAISFVLGVRSSSLRSAALKDLIYRSGSKKGKGKGKAVDQDNAGSDASDDDEGNGDAESDEGVEDEDEGGEKDGERKAWVIAVYIEQEKEWKFQRSYVSSCAV